MPEPPTTWVQLSDFKIAGLKVDSKQTANQPSTSTPAQLPSQVSVEEELLSAARPKPYERLAADKPGEELAPDAGIWQLYVEEATEHDTELVQEKNNNLDVMLIFAGIFSAILTAFLIESKNLLQQDSGDLAITLLLAIAQSQQRLEQNNPQILPSVEIPKFSPSVSARWINGLWFTALSLSLAAALIAMLAKEWLIAFTTSRSRSARAYAHLHQKRLQGMKKWRALHIIDLLPSMLHLSLLLFSLGLAIYLWTLDTGIAIAGVVIAALALGFYIATAVSGAVYKSCPFVTQVSKYMRTTLISLHLKNPTVSRSIDSQDENQPTECLDGDLQAISWLTEHSSDPVISDCACQALAGLPVSGIPARVTTPNGMFDANTRLGGILQTIRARTWLRNQKPSPQLQAPSHSLSPANHRRLPVGSLFEHVCARLHNAKSRQRRDFKACRGINVARYSGALPVLVQYLESNTAESLTADEKALHATDMAANGFTQLGFEAIDAVWNNECPEFSPNAYALLVSADLRLTETATRIHHPKPDPDSLPSLSQSDTQDSAQDRNLVPNTSVEVTSTTINMNSHTSSSSIMIVSLHELRARYSRTLARASILLRLHYVGRITISSHHLAYLLDTINLAARCENLHMMSQLSTAFPQLSMTDDLPKFAIGLAGTGTLKYTPSLDIGDEDNLLPCLVTMVSFPNIEQTPEVEISAVRALATIGPILVSQWRNKMNTCSVELANKEILSQILTSWPKSSSQDHLRYIPQDTISQLLWIATAALSQFDSRYMSGLAKVAVEALFSRTNMESGRSVLFGIGDAHIELFELFIQVMGHKDSNMSRETRGQCLQLLLIEKYNGTLLSRSCITPRSLLNLLRLIANTPGYPSEVRSILVGLKSRLPDYEAGRTSYIFSFMRQVDGFTTLIDIIAISDYTVAAIDSAPEVFKVATTNSASYSYLGEQQLALVATPGLLAVMRQIIQNTTSDTKDGQRLVSCTRNAIALLKEIDIYELDLAIINSCMYQIIEELASACELHADIGAIHMEWEMLYNRMPIDGWYLEGLTELFDSSPEVETNDVLLHNSPIEEGPR